MLRSHSLLWHYLWLAPEILQVGLAVLICRRGLYRRFPVFLVYAIYEAFETLTLYALDVLPSVSPEAWWRAFWIGSIIEGFVRLAVIGELLRHLLGPRPALAKVGSRLFVYTGAGLTLLAAIAAAHTAPENPHLLVRGGLILQQTFYIIQCGLILFVFFFAAWSKISWDRLSFGIALGFGIVFCQHLAAWAIEAGVALPDHGVLLDFLNMATYHVCVLIWFYYLLVPQKVSATSAISVPENSLDIWNRELERLLQR
jgi:hypothetical protein